MSAHLEAQPPLPALSDAAVPGSRFFQTLRRHPGGAIGTAIVLLFILVALTAPLIAPFPDQGRGTANVPARDQAPSLEHPFGTDRLGRDGLSRVLFAARPALTIAFVVVVLAVLIGVPLGLVAGYRGGWLDEVLMRITDLFLAFPPLLLAMVITAILGPSLLNAGLALVVSWWPWYARLARTVTQSLRDRPFIEAARVFGVREPVILVRHVLRNSLTPIIVQATVDLGTVILAVGALAFLGLAAQPPAADWGLMIADGRTTVLSQWWISTFPGLTIFLLVLGFNLLGDAVRDLLDPRDASR